jgi:hypothetical protein
VSLPGEVLGSTEQISRLLAQVPENENPGLDDSFGLSDQAGWQWGITLAGVLCLSGATLWWWIRPERSADRA